MNEKEFERRVLVELNRCKHFNGVINDTCNAGVNYHELLGTGAGCFAHMPCFRDDATAVTCPKAQFPTDKEARKHVEEQDQHIREFIEQLDNGVCPVCKKEVLQRQVGSCVYGTCGHRLYQGKVNPKFVAVDKRIHSTRKLS